MINPSSILSAAAELCSRRQTLLGYTDVTGTDNSDKALKDTKQNLKWLNEKQNYCSTQNS